MDRKIRLGINLFFNNTTNSGIVNYIYNIVSALKTLPAEKQPDIVIFHSADAPVPFIKSINYPSIAFVQFKPYAGNKLGNGLNRLVRKLTGINYYQKLKYFDKVDVLYPYFGFSDKEFEPVKHKIHWLVDFNNRAFPDHYPNKGQEMLDFQTELTQSPVRIVLSSNALLQELKTYYPGYKCIPEVVNFACTLPDIDYLDIHSLKEKFKIDGAYFMSPNQFWEHKNQLTLIKAMGLLKQNGKLNFKLVFTGSMAVNRGKGHQLEILQQEIARLQLNHDIAFLGIIDRSEQLALMKHATGLVQPSLYEGWSTLVEEAKVLNQYIVLSDLPVHREQNCLNAYYFDPLDAGQLADGLLQGMQLPQKKVTDYNANIRKFGYDLLDVIKKELSQS